MNHLKLLPTFAVVDDDPDYRELIQASFAKCSCIVEGLGSLDELRKRIKTQRFEVVLLDVYLGSERGLNVIPYLLSHAPQTKIVVMTAFGTIDLAVEAMKQGASSFVVKTSDPRHIAQEVMGLIAQSDQDSHDSDPFHEYGLIGLSPKMSQVKNLIQSLKDIHSTVLLTGESGTGKELVARALHFLSQRKEQPFHAINCGAIPENLLESELFGHKRGAFTDAKENRRGLFEICADGTLLLDEIGEMPMHLQVKLLRVLQEKEFTPVGASRTIKVNTRIIAATNRDLYKEVQKGNFREDLFYRLNVIHLEIPPLRERSDDIPMLVEFFLKQCSASYSKSIAPPTEELLTRLKVYDWPGNIRELRNAIERGVVLAKYGHLDYDDMFYQSGKKASGITVEMDFDQFFGAQLPEFTEARRNFEKAYLKKVLHLSKGNIATASRLAGRYRADIYRLMNKYGLNRNGTCDL